MEQSVMNNIEVKLKDALMDQVSGGQHGRTNDRDRNEVYEKHRCSHCKKVTVFVMYSGGRGSCTECGNPLS